MEDSQGNEGYVDVRLPGWSMLSNPPRIVLQLFAPVVLGLMFWAAMTVVCSMTGKANRQTLLGLSAPSVLVTLVLYSIFWQKWIVGTATNSPLLFTVAVTVMLSSMGYVIARNWNRLLVTLGGDLREGFWNRRFVANNRDLVLTIWGGVNLLGLLILSVYAAFFK